MHRVQADRQRLDQRALAIAHGVGQAQCLAGPHLHELGVGARRDAEARGHDLRAADAVARETGGAAAAANERQGAHALAHPEARPGLAADLDDFAGELVPHHAAGGQARRQRRRVQVRAADAAAADAQQQVGRARPRLRNLGDLEGLAEGAKDGGLHGLSRGGWMLQLDMEARPNLASLGAPDGAPRLVCVHPKESP